MNATTLNAVRAPQQFETIIVNPLTLNIGAEIFGVDLSKPLAEGKFNEILAAIYTHQVIFFRDQHLSAAQLVEFAKVLGEPQPSAESSFAKIAAYPEIDVLDFDGERPPHNTKELWHTDFSGREKPTLGSVLYALEVPSSGGDTVWTSLTAAYDALSAPLKRYLSGLQAEHHTLKAFGDDIRSVLWQDDAGRQRFAELRAIPPVAHPVVRTHPVTQRKALFINEGFTKRLLGVPQAESDAVLGYLFAHTQTPEFQVRFRWQKHSVAVWDNRITKHYAISDYRERRVMHRITIKGERPF